MALSKEDILGFANADPVKVKAFGGEVLMMPMSGFSRDNFEAGLVGRSGGTNTVNIRAKMVSACCVTLIDGKSGDHEDDYELMFTEKDVSALGKKSAKELDKLYEVARSLSGFDDKDIDELAKN